MPETQILAEPGQPEVTITCLLAADGEQVFKVLTDPELIPQWWGPASLTTTVEKMDVRSGGEWRFIQQDAEGVLYHFSGVYSSVRAPDELASTFIFEAEPASSMLEVITLENHGSQTRIIDRLIARTVQDRDAILLAGMEEGAIESMERLEALLKKINLSSEV